MNTKTSSRKYAGQSESERVLERKARFLEAGLELFGTIGLKATKVKALCTAAGLTERYFYESFANIEELFIAVYRDQYQRMQSFFIEKLPELTDEIEERTAAALDIYFELIKDERLVRVMLLESMVGSAAVQQMHQDNMRQMAKLAAQFIRVDNPNLDIGDDILELTALAINGAVNALATQWMLEQYRAPKRDVVYSAALAVKGIMAEIRSH